MKTIKLCLYVPVLCCIMTVGIGITEVRGESLSTLPPFPYQKYIDAMSQDDYSPTIDDDGDGFVAITHKIRYPKVKGEHSAFVDSLLEQYNMLLAFNTMAYDVSTAERYFDQKDMVMMIADAVESTNVSGINDIKRREAMVRAGKDVAQFLREDKRPNEEKSHAAEELTKLFYELNDALLASHGNNDEFDPSKVVGDYAVIHEKAISDTTYRKELLTQVLSETDFAKKCVLAREFGYANFRSPDRNDMELMTVLDAILKEGKYSPLLNDLWIMWRIALQQFLGGLSNDSAMYNLLYNDVRNDVASVYLDHLQNHPDDGVAYNSFMELAFRMPILRNSGFVFGNNSSLDEMEIYQELYSTNK